MGHNPRSRSLNKTLAIILSIIFIGLGFSLASKTLPFKVNELISQGEPTRIQFEKYDKDFQNESDFFLLFKPDKIERKHQSLKRIHKALKKHPAILNLTDLTNAEFLTVKGDYIQLRQIELLKDKTILQHPFLKKLYQSEDKKTYLISGSFKKFDGIKTERRLIGDFLTLVDSFRAEGRIESIGTKIAQYYYFLETVKTQMLLTPLLFVLIALLVYFLFRSFSLLIFFFWIVLLSYASIIFAIYINEGGISSYSGFAMFFVLIVATSDLVHFFHAFQEEYRESIEERLETTKKKVFKPCLFTSLTTAFCFISLIPNSVIPISSIGIYAALGSIICFVFTFYLLPTLIIIFQYNPIDSKGIKTLELDPLLKFSLKRPLLVISIFFFSGVTFLTQLPHIVIDDDFYHKFKDTHPLTSAVNQYQKDFQTLGSIDLTYSEIKDRDSISKFENQIEKEIPQISYIKSYYGMLGYIRDAFKLLPESKWKEDRIQSLIDLIQSRKIFSQFYSDNYKRALVYVRSTSTADTQKALTQIEKLAKKYESQFKVQPQGFITLRTYVLQSLIEQFLLSFGVSLILVFLSFIWLFKKIHWAILGLIPNIFPLVFIGGIIALSGLSIDSNLVLMICVSFGIAVDDTIHFLYALKLELKQKSLKPAIASAFNKTNKALFGTTLIFSLSFPCFFLADLKIFYLSGGFIVLSLIFALAADLFLLPAIFALKTRSEP